MRFDIVTIFPEFFAGPLDYGIVRRARESGLIDVHVQDLRAFTHDRHRTVDDRPFGGGEGMVLKCEPLFEAVESLLGQGVAPGSVPQAESASPANGANSPDPHPATPEPEEPPPAAVDSASPSNATAVILLSASGKPFRQSTARRLARLNRIILLCGRYEGVDERVAEHLATEELSIGDFVLSGGELAAALVVDAVTRLLPGALGNEASSLYESFSAPPDAASRELGAQTSVRTSFEISQSPSSNAASETHGAAQRQTGAIGAGAAAADSPSNDRRRQGSTPAAGEAQHLLVESPHYTRPAEFRGWQVPEVLLGGNHEEVRRWRQRMAVEKTRRNRPDLLNNVRPLADRSF